MMIDGDWVGCVGGWGNGDTLAAVNSLGQCRLCLWAMALARTNPLEPNLKSECLAIDRRNSKHWHKNFITQMHTTDFENKINKDRNMLFVLSDGKERPQELNDLIEHFCGGVHFDFDETRLPADKKVYICGDLSKIGAFASPMYVIAELSSHYEKCAEHENFHLVTLGQVPILVHHMGVYYRNFFEKDISFGNIKSEHTFQELTESTKETKSFRKGIYLTEVLKETKENDEMLHFRLLRCSSNLTGPSDNFRKTDRKIIHALNDAVRFVFEDETNLNHALVQIYENKKKDNEKEVKSKIKAHSDKTKDMPKNGLIAFCTFYDMTNTHPLQAPATDRFDLCYKGISALTRLHFKLKNTIVDDFLAKEFSVTLYPNSVFIIPLSTNRLYTHEIKPSILNIDKIPTRMGYVVRCSNVEALHMNNQTFIKEDGKWIPLTQMTDEMLVNLRNSYYKENTSEQIVDYGKVHFSMNAGDYEKPIF